MITGLHDKLRSFCTSRVQVSGGSDGGDGDADEHTLFMQTLAWDLGRSPLQLTLEGKRGLRSFLALFSKVLLGETACPGLRYIVMMNIL